MITVQLYNVRRSAIHWLKDQNAEKRTNDYVNDYVKCEMKQMTT